MKTIVIDESGTGRITASSVIDPNSLAVLNQPYLETEDFVPTRDVTHYVVGGMLAPRPTLNVPGETTVRADGVDEFVLSGLPEGVQLRLFGPTDAEGVTDGMDVVLTFALAGDYDLVLRKFPYQDTEVTIHAV